MPSLSEILPEGAIITKSRDGSVLIRLNNNKYRRICPNCGRLKSLSGILCWDCNLPERIERSRNFGFSLGGKSRSQDAIQKGIATAKANGSTKRNIARLAEGNRGRKASPEHIAKIIASNKRRKTRQSTREKHRVAAYKLWEEGKASSRVGTGKRGIRIDILPLSGFRSSWEANFARFLNHVGIKWQFEPTRFKLSTGESYCPDFLLENGTFIEIKGYWSVRANRIVALFKQEYPDIKLRILDEPKYKKLKAKCSHLENWE